MPHANQIRWFVGNTQDDAPPGARSAACSSRATRRSPPAQLLEGGGSTAIAQRVGRTPAQVAIRYLLEKDVLPLPKSSTPKRIAENADVDFSLDADAIAELDAITD